MPSRSYRHFIRKLFLLDGKSKGQNNKFTEITATGTELNYADGANVLNDTANTFALLTTGGALNLSGDLGTQKNVGVSTATSVSEGGTSARHTSKFTFTAWDIGAIAAMADEATGKAFYTFPSVGDIIVHKASLVGALTGVVAIEDDTPELGIGTVVGTGAVATLGTTPAFENVKEGFAVTDCKGTTDEISHGAPTAGSDLVLTKGATNKLFLNVADGWAAASATLYFTGTIWVDWYLRSY